MAKLGLFLTVIVVCFVVCGGQESTGTNSTGDEIEQNVGGLDLKRSSPNFFRCTRQSVSLARQALAHELESASSFGNLWLTDLDKEELMESQKESLSNMMMQDSAIITNGDGQPLFEIDSSYFRTAHIRQHRNQTTHSSEPTSIRLMRRHVDRCHLTANKASYHYTFGLTIGPIEHNLDVVYNLPRDLRLSQPTSWKYGQVSLLVSRMHYEVSIKQAAQYKLNHGCPLEVSDVTFLKTPPPGLQAGTIHMQTIGIANNNQTVQYLERFFNDFTRPAVSNRLRQLLKFQLNSKTLPLMSV